MRLATWHRRRRHPIAARPPEQRAPGCYYSARLNPRSLPSKPGNVARRVRPADPILAAFARTLRREPLAPLAISARRRATVEDVAALARAAGARLAPRTG
ncbi:MAG TPA: hypothetical protein VF121_19035, partial [Thermoanaerobaculia bacterium]|nr:hypothetical protein [Thermoanaerobaculia bacterium]